MSIEPKCCFTASYGDARASALRVSEIWRALWHGAWTENLVWTQSGALVLRDPFITGMVGVDRLPIVVRPAASKSSLPLLERWNDQHRPRDPGAIAAPLDRVARSHIRPSSVSRTVDLSSGK